MRHTIYNSATIVPLWTFLIWLTTSCQMSPTDSTSKDIVTDIPGDEHGKTLYFIEGDNLVRKKCPEDGSPTRTRCTEVITSRDYSEVRQRLSDGKLERRQEIDGELETVEQELAQVEEELGQKRSEQSTTNTDIAEKSTEQRDKKRDLTTAENEKTEALQKFEQLTIALSQNHNPQTQTELDETRQRLRTLQVTINDLQTTIDTLDEEIATLKTKAEDLDPEIEALQTKANELQQKEGELQTELSEIAQQTSQLQSFLSLLEEDGIVFPIGEDTALFAEMKPFLEQLGTILEGQPGNCPDESLLFEYGSCWFLSRHGESCLQECERHGLSYDEATRNVAGDLSENDTACMELQAQLVVDAGSFNQTGRVECGTNGSLGCIAWFSSGANFLHLCVGGESTSPEARAPRARRICACHR